MRPAADIVSIIAIALSLATAGCGDDPLEASDALAASDTTTAPPPDGAAPLDSAAPEIDGDVGGGDDATSPEVGEVGEPPPLPEPAMDGYVRAVDASWWINMDDFVFGVVRPSGVRLYLALLDGNHYRDEAFRAYGRALVRHPESFFANALVPLLERYSDALWAIDCMNEPEAMVAGLDGNYQDWGVSWDEMRAYLAACADVVHTYGHGVAVSAGSGWHDWHNAAKGYYDGLGFDHLDFHVYADDVDLPAAASLSDLPVIVGECGQRTERWDDALQLAATRACFEEAHAEGYAAALGWYYDRPGSTNHLAHKNADDTWRPVRLAFEEAAARGQRVGLNLAWFDGAYDHDFGENPRHPEWGVAYDGAALRRIVADYDAVEIPLMRLWAFEGQEALAFHVLYADFASDPGARDDFVAFGPTALLVTSGGVGVDVRTDERGWYGIEHASHAGAPLDLRAARAFSYEVANDLGAAIGVNLAIVVEAGDGALTTYQTRVASQQWLEPGASASASVPLDAASFADAWAVDSAPSAGVAHPGEALAKVVAVRLRFHLDGTSAVSGVLRIRRIAISGGAP